MAFVFISFDPNVLDLFNRCGREEVAEGLVCHCGVIRFATFLYHNTIQISLFLFPLLRGVKQLDCWSVYSCKGKGIWSFKTNKIVMIVQHIYIHVMKTLIL